MTRTARYGVAAGGFAAAAALIVWFFAWALSFPPRIAYGATNGSVNLNLQTVGTIGFGEHPTWVSYLAQQPNGVWEHSTVWTLPANTTVHVTVYEYDTEGPLRNQFMGLVNGVDGNVEYLNGKPLSVSNAGGSTAPAHTFSVPALGINVPLVGVNPNAKNMCATAPCPTNTAHNTITFTFHTGGPGVFRWQCFVPCGLSYLDGNAGPMQTLGYMGGFIKVVSA